MLQIIDPGGTCNFLYRLHKQPADTAGNALGKLEIKWHGTMGEVGRLQTQQIMGSATWRKVRVPSAMSSCKILALYIAQAGVRTCQKRWAHCIAGSASWRDALDGHPLCTAQDPHTEPAGVAP